MGPPDGKAPDQRSGVAVRTGAGAVPRHSGAGRRLCPADHRSAAVALLQCCQNGVAAAALPCGAGGRPTGHAVSGHGGYVAAVLPDGGPHLRHGRVQRLPHSADGSAPYPLGPAAAGAVRHPAGGAAGDPVQRRPVRHHYAGRAVPPGRTHPCRDGGFPRGAVRRGLRLRGYGQGHLWHRQLGDAFHRTAACGQPPRAGGHCGVGPERADILRTGGQYQLCRRRHRMAHPSGGPSYLRR